MKTVNSHFLDNVLNLHTYSYYPDIKKMKMTEGDQYDYIVLGFEFTYPLNEGRNKLSNTLVCYFFVDKYENEINISFEIALDSITENNYNYHIDKGLNKISRTKKVNIQDYDTVVLKLKEKNVQKNITHFSNYSELIDSYIDNHMQLHFLEVKSFIEKNGINYSKKEFKKLTETVSVEYKKDHLKTTFAKDINLVILHNHLNHDLTDKDIAIKKMKI